MGAAARLPILSMEQINAVMRQRCNSILVLRCMMADVVGEFGLLPREFSAGMTQSFYSNGTGLWS
jgi:hypothetical protein